MNSIACTGCHQQVLLAIDDQKTARCCGCGTIVDRSWIDDRHVSASSGSDAGTCETEDSSSPDAAVLPALQVGDHIGHYVLQERLGEGSFGLVWKAYDSKLQRCVAIKMPRRATLDEDEIKQFLKEARTVARLNHSGIVSVFEVGQFGGRPYIVTELIDGEDLRDQLSAGRRTQ